MSAILLPGDILKCFQKLRGYTAVQLAMKVGWFSPQVVSNLRSISVKNPGEWRQRRFTEAHYQELIAAFPHEFSPGAPLRRKLDAAMERQSLVLAYGREALQPNWTPPEPKLMIRENDFFSSAMELIQRLMPGIGAQGMAEKRTRILREAISVCRGLIDLIDDELATGAITPDNVETKGLGTKSNQGLLPPRIETLLMSVAYEFRESAWEQSDVT